MAKKWGKRGKPAQYPAAVDADPRNMFGVPPAPRSAPPASSTPLADHLRRGWPGVDSGYVVLPRSVAESMPLPWQQQLAQLLTQFHETHNRLTWPVYRVVPSRPERLVDLDEDQLAEAGYLAEIDADGEMVYRERSGRKVEQPEDTTVLVSCLDPIVRRPAVEPPPAQQGAPRTGPAPMNIGPQPVWRTTEQSPAAAPPLPPPPTAHSVATPTPTPTPTPAEPAVPAQPFSGPIPEAPAEPAADRAPETPTEPEPRAAESPTAESREPETPPRGVQRPRGWFDELPSVDPEQRSGGENGSGDEFGPTGEPTEIPYRYRH